MSHSPRSRSAQRGNALLSVAIGLVLVSVILAGIIMWFANTQRQAAAVGLGRSIIELQLGIENGFQHRANYRYLHSEWVVDSGILPSGLSANGNRIRHQLGGRVWIGNATTGPADAYNLMRIGITDLDTDICVSLVQQLAPALGDQIYGFRIGDGPQDHHDGNTYTDGDTYPTVSEMVRDCQVAAGGSNTPNLILYFRK